MNDIIVSSLLNLFALFGASSGRERENSAKVFSSYLNRHFSVRDIDSYVELFNDLFDLYGSTPELDKAAVANGICSKLQGKITIQEQALMLLRLMEFCAGTDTDKIQAENQQELFRIVASDFNISDDLYADMLSFVLNDGKSQNVSCIPYNGTQDYIKSLYLPSFNQLVFTYIGADEVQMNDVPVLQGVFQIWQPSGVLKCKKAKPMYYSTVLARTASSLSSAQSKNIVLRGDNVNFRFPDSDNGIHNFSFELKSGQLVAIMGGSGVGKSTLLSLLNGNLRPQEGSITINGHDIGDADTKVLIGYVPQDDLLIEELTVYQNLWFTAKLCFDDLSAEELDRKVMAVLKNLGLEAAANLKVGSPINKYISGGQRKRLNIALELIREPAVLYLDEPTSGLSSSDTEKVVNLLKDQACQGRLVIANIHQPSSDVYKLFDHLWLLDKGGYPVYDGNPIEAITYFKRAANYADDSNSMCPLCGNVTPDVVLNIIDEKVLDNMGQLTDKRRIKPQEWHQMYLDARKHEGQAITEEKIALPKTEQKKLSAWKQLQIFLLRNFKTKISNLQYLFITLLEAPLLALICGYLTRYAPAEGYSIMENKNLLSYFFMAVIVAIFIGMSGSAEEIIRDRAILKREKFLNLSHASYIWSKILYMAGVSLIQTLLFVVVGNAVMCIHDQFFVWWMILFVVAVLSSLIGLLLSQCLNSVVAIYISIPLLLIPQILLCGLVVKFSDLTPNSKTGNVPVIGDFIPSRWAYEALAVTSFANNSYEKDIFDLEKEKYVAQYCQHVFLYEMQSQLEAMNDEQKHGKEVNPEHLNVIRTEIHRLPKICSDVPAYNGDFTYESLKQYFQQAEDILAKWNNVSTLVLDKEVTKRVRQMGSKEMLKLKKKYYNLRLEGEVMNTSAHETCKIVGNHIVPQVGAIFLDPVSRNGRAPFYASTKYIGNLGIPTLWFNTLVEIIMCAVVALCLFFDIPGRYVRKERN